MSHVVMPCGVEEGGREPRMERWGMVVWGVRPFLAVDAWARLRATCKALHRDMDVDYDAVGAGVTAASHAALAAVASGRPVPPRPGVTAVTCAVPCRNPVATVWCHDWMGMVDEHGGFHFAPSGVSAAAAARKRARMDGVAATTSHRFALPWRRVKLDPDLRSHTKSGPGATTPMPPFRALATSDGVQVCIVVNTTVAIATAATVAPVRPAVRCYLFTWQEAAREVPTLAGMAAAGRLKPRRCFTWVMEEEEGVAPPCCAVRVAGDTVIRVHDDGTVHVHDAYTGRQRGVTSPWPCRLPPVVDAHLTVTGHAAVVVHQDCTVRLVPTITPVDLAAAEGASGVVRLPTIPLAYMHGVTDHIMVAHPPPPTAAVSPYATHGDVGVDWGVVPAGWLWPVVGGITLPSGGQVPAATTHTTSTPPSTRWAVDGSSWSGDVAYVAGAWPARGAAGTMSQCAQAVHSKCDDTLHLLLYRLTPVTPATRAILALSGLIAWLEWLVAEPSAAAWASVAGSVRDAATWHAAMPSLAPLPPPIPRPFPTLTAGLDGAYLLFGPRGVADLAVRQSNEHGEKRVRVCLDLHTATNPAGATMFVSPGQAGWLVNPFVHAGAVRWAVLTTAMQVVWN